MSETSAGAFSGAASGAAAGSAAGPWGALAGGVIGGISGALGGSAARRARQAQEQATREAMARQDQNRDQIFARQQPYSDVGAQGLSQLRQFQNTPTQASDVYNDPGYRFAQQQGMDATQGSAAARGGLYSGAALKELTNFNSGNANRFFNDAFSRNQTDTTNRFNRATSMTGVGERSVANMNSAGTHTADMNGQYGTGQGNATAASYLASGAQNQNALNSAGGALLSTMQQPPQSGGYTPNATIPYSAPGAQYRDTYAPKYKDGGPVMADDGGGRMVPKVGTRSPLPGAAGGGMSREAVMQALSMPAAGAASAPRSGLAALPVNPVSNPGGLRRVQVDEATGYKAGGRVNYTDGGAAKGARAPRSDDIAAWLSDGEHVVTAEDVDALGGHAALRKMIQEGKKRGC